ncbi:MAG: hypothetical protein RPT95_10360 [Candidatus Sedimenticola sp. (ex Thyasira tokunagai)]
MPRLPADITINIHNHRTGRKLKLELIGQPMDSGRVWLRRDRRNSRLLPDTTITEITNLMRSWLSAEIKKRTLDTTKKTQ